MSNVRTYHLSSITWEDGPFSVGFLRADGCLCPDGTRRTAYPSGTGTADTFFSIPARVRVTRDGGRFTVSGYISVATMSGSSVETEDDPSTVYFHPYLYGTNGYVLARTEDLAQYVRKHEDYARARVEMFAREDEDSRYLDPYRETADERYPHVDKARDEITRREAGK